MANIPRLAAAILFGLLLAGCSDDGSSNPIAPAIQPPPPAATGTTVSGIAAVGAALANATVEVIDASGNPVAIVPTTTGSDGSYTVVLPGGTQLPVIVRIVPDEGPPLQTVVPLPTGAGTDEIVANVNPITSAVADQLLGEADEPAELSAALSGADEATVDALGDSVVDAVFGEGADYAQFANDPDFVASSGAGPGSTSDALLDALEDFAEGEGQSVDALIAGAVEEVAAAGDTPLNRRRARLFDNPAFLAQFVDQLLDNGLSAAEVEDRLANPQPGDPRLGEDAAATVVALVEILEGVQADATAATAGIVDPELRERIEDGAVDAIADGLFTKLERLRAPNVVGALGGRANVRAGLTQAVVGRLVEIVTAAQDAGLDASSPLGLAAIIDRVAEIAALGIAALDFSDPAIDPGALLAAYVDANLPADIAAAITDVQGAIDGGAEAGDAIANVVPLDPDVSDASGEMQQLAGENPDLDPGDGAFEAVPGRWNVDSWNTFIWG